MAAPTSVESRKVPDLIGAGSGHKVMLQSVKEQQKDKKDKKDERDKKIKAAKKAPKAVKPVKVVEKSSCNTITRGGVTNPIPRGHLESRKC